MSDEISHLSSILEATNSAGVFTELPSLNTDRQQFMSFSADEQGAEINITNYPTRLRELESALQGQLSAANAQIQNVDAELARLQPQRGAVSPAQQLQAELLRINRRSLEAAASNSRALSESVRYLQRTAAILSPNDRPPTEAETDPTLNLLRTAFARDDDAHLVERMRAMAQGGLTFARDNPHQVLSEQDMATVTEMTERMLAAADSVDPDSISSLKDFVRNMEAMVSTASIGNLLSAPVQAAWRSYVVPHQGPSTPERLESMSALLPEALRDVAAGFGAHGYVDTANSVRDIGSFTQEHLQDILAQISNVEEEFITERPQPAQLSSEPYEYDELPTATSLRLLRIHSVQDGIVYCSLDVADLTCLSQRSFTALSYVWGDHRPPLFANFYSERARQEFPILCNGRMLSITLNLRQALEVLSSSTWKEDYYWIDQICINQASSDERSAQVAMMDRVYSSAKRVLAWLGPQDKFTGDAMQMIRSLASIPRDEYREPGFEVERTIQQYPVGSWVALSALLSRPYFRRAWIVQETTLARELRVLCGSGEMSWDEMVRCSKFINETKAWMVLPDHAKRFEAQPDVNPDLARYGAAALFGDQLSALISTREAFLDGAMPLEELLLLGRRFGATNPRDHAYAMLGLIKANMLSRSTPLALPHPSYEDSVEQAFLDFGECFLSMPSGLRLLSQVEDHSCRSLTSLPSWVPDLSTRLWPQPLSPSKTPSWCAPPNLPEQQTTSWCVSRHLQPTGWTVHGRELSLSGARLDTISGVAAPFDADTFWHTAFLLLETLRDTSHCVTRLDRALMRTLLAASCEDDVPCGEHAALEEGPFACWIIDGLRSLRRRSPDNILRSQNRILDAATQAIGWIGDYVEDLRNNREARVRAMIQHSMSNMSLMEASINQDDADVNRETQAASIYRSTVEAMARVWYHGSILPSAEQLVELLGILNGPDTDLKASAKRSIERFSAVVGVNIKCRRLFTSAEGRLGMGPLSLRENDTIWALPGADVPFILRRLDSGYYQLIGQAFVYGIMYGEAISDGTRLEQIQLR